MTNLTTDEMRLYQRARRARIKAEQEGQPVIDTALPRSAIVKASGAELATIPAKAAASGPGAVITKTGGRFDVLSRDAFEARHTPSASPRRASTNAQPPASPAFGGASSSMLAIGGKAGTGRAVAGYDPQRAPLDPQSISIGVGMVNMLGALAARSDTLERRVAQLEAAEAERVGREAASRKRIAEGVVGMLRLAFGPRE